MIAVASRLPLSSRHTTLSDDDEWCPERRVGVVGLLLIGHLDFFQSAKPTEPGGEVLLPGDVERRNRAARLVEGVPLTDDVWSALVETARAVGVVAHEIAAPSV